MDIGAWVGEQARTYFDNAGMAREYRTQLRGIKAPLFLSAYLGLFVLLASFFYFGVTFTSDRSISSIQQQLSVFYNIVVGMLEFLVALVAPVLAATSIVGEYQRQSIDLLFSSPVGPKYFLVGKLLASYRYVLLLLVLTLPVAAVCVVLGGATWRDVAATYLLVSFHGLVYMSISMPVAVMTAKAVPTVMWSYLASILFAIATMVVNFSFGPGMMTSGSAPILLGLSPFLAAAAGGMTTTIGALTLPLWVPAGIFTLLFARLMVLGAGAALTQAGSMEAFNLRLTGLLLCFLVPLIAGYAAGTSRVPFASGGSEIAIVAWNLAWPLLIPLPHLSTWAGSGGAKALPNGWWRPRFALRGTPASGLPYLCALLLSLIAGTAIAMAPSVGMSGQTVLYLLGFVSTWVLAWGLGWLASGFAFRSGIEASRRLHVLFMFLVFVVPAIALAIFENGGRAQGYTALEGITNKVYLFTFVGEDLAKASYKIPIICGLAVLTVFFAELKRRKAVELMRSPS